MWVALSAMIAFAEDPAASDAPTPPAERPAFRLPAPAPPAGYQIGVGAGYYASIVEGDFAITPPPWPQTFAFAFRGPRYTWVPAFDARVNLGQEGEALEAALGGSGSVSFFKTPDAARVLAVQPALSVGGHASLFRESIPAGPLNEGIELRRVYASAGFNVGVHVQRWFGSRVTADLHFTALGGGVSYEEARDDDELAREVALYGGLSPTAKATASYYFDRPRKTARMARKSK